MYTDYVIEEVILGHSEFDFEAAMRELLKWKGELSDDNDDDAKVISTLDGVIDIMIDSCSF